MPNSNCRHQILNTEFKSDIIRKLTSENTPSTVLLSVADVDLFFSEQRKSILDKFNDLDVAIPKIDRKLLTLQEAKLVTLFHHQNSIVIQLESGVDYIENMLYEQLTSAIGKEIQPHHFAEFMIHYNRKLFKPEYRMQPFSFAVRRPEHYPEGGVSIESEDASGVSPIYTSFSQVEEPAPMKMALNASSTIVLGGQRYVHSWVNHTFGSQQEPSINLVARARQFSSFILVVGRLIDRNTLEYDLFVTLVRKER